MNTPQPPNRFSYSSASRYRQCPLSWRFKYVDRLPDPAGPPAVIGSFVHSCLEHFYQRPGAERTEDTLRTVAGRLWQAKEVAAELAAVGAGDEHTSKREAWELLRGLWEVEDPAGVAVVSTEERVALNLTGVPLLAIRLGGKRPLRGAPGAAVRVVRVHRTVPGGPRRSRRAGRSPQDAKRRASAGDPRDGGGAVGESVATAAFCGRRMTVLWRAGERKPGPWGPRASPLPPRGIFAPRRQRSGLPRHLVLPAMRSPRHYATRAAQGHARHRWQVSAGEHGSTRFHPHRRPARAPAAG